MIARCQSFRIGFKPFVLLLALTVSSRANDLLVMSATPAAILRFDGASGSSRGQFAAVSNGSAMTYGPDGNLYVANRNSVMRLDGQTGALLNVFVPPTNNVLVPQATGMTFGPDGNLYIAGTSNVTGTATAGVWRYNGSTGQLMDMFVKPSFSSTAGGVAFGPDGNLYVADGFNVDRYNGLSGDFMSHFAHGGGLERAKQLRFGPDGNIYVMSNQLLKFNGNSGAFISNLGFVGSGSTYTFGPEGDLYAVYTSLVDRYTLTGTRIDNFVSNGGYSSPQAAVFVPEPDTILLLVLVAPMMLIQPRRRIPFCKARQS